MTQIWRAFRLTPPGGQTFFAALVEDAQGQISVVSTRDGEWKPETAISAADLLMPEFDLNEWDVEEIEPDKAPPFSTTVKGSANIENPQPSTTVGGGYRQ